MMKPCLDCGMAAPAERCQPCGDRYNRGKYRQQTAVRKSRGGRPQYGGDWATVSKVVRANATVCHICRKGADPNDPWQADHLTPAQWGGGAGPVLSAHRSCNIGRGNRTRRQVQT
jgi:hypothetical protein